MTSIPLFERWLPVVGWEGIYEVSDFGRVRSLYRKGRTRGKVLKQVNDGGYRNVTLSDLPRYSIAKVHQLVMEAFVGPRPEGLEVCHYDGDGSNNRLDNLRYDTRAANQQDRLRHGRHNMANKTHCPADHEYTPENTYMYRGERICRACLLPRNREYQRRKRLASREPD